MDRKVVVVMPRDVETGEVTSIALARGERQFLYTKKGLFLLQNINWFGSLLIDNALARPDVYICFHFNCCFIVLPVLLSNSECYRTYDDVLVESKIGQYLNNPYIKEEILNICDNTQYEDQLMIRLNQEKFEQWIQQKVNTLINSIIQTVPFAPHKEYATKVAYGVLYEYTDDAAFARITANADPKDILGQSPALNAPLPIPKPLLKSKSKAKANPKVPLKGQPALTRFFPKDKASKDI